MTLEQLQDIKIDKKFDALDLLLAGVKTYEELQTRMAEIRAQDPVLADWIIKRGLEGHEDVDDVIATPRP